MDEGIREVTMEKSAFPNFELLDSEIYDDSSCQILLPSQPPDIRNWFSSYESQQSVDSIKDAYFPHIAESHDSETQDPFEDSRKRKLQEPCLSPEKIQPALGKDTIERDDTLNSTTPTFRRKSTGTDNVVVKKKQSLRQILGDEFLTSCPKILIDQSLSPDKKKIIPKSDNHEESKCNKLETKIVQEELEKNCQELSSVNSEQKKEDRTHHITEKPYQNTSETGFISLKRPKLHGNSENKTKKCQSPPILQKEHETKSVENFGNEDHNQVGLRRLLVDKDNLADKDRDGGFRGTSANNANFSVDAVPTELSSGKWQCPRKRKPYVGPPLKQLLLERWIR